MFSLCLPSSALQNLSYFLAKTMSEALRGSESETEM